MARTTNKQKVIVIGAGPVGALAALYAAKRGDDVEVYELRGDLRDSSTTPLNFTKSINLALSERGIKAMRDSECPGLIEDVLSETIPMHGRMIHARSKLGELYEESQQYDVYGRAIQAVDRAGLNKRLLDALETFPNVSLKFNHKLTGADFKKNLAWLEDLTVSPTFDPSNPMHRFPEIEVPFDLMIGADGAHSAARFHLMKFARLNYSQTYIDTLWCEFHIPPREKPDSESFDSKFLISPHHLHIWPGGSFMFIAIPSPDGSFTCTLFAPSATFQQLSSAHDRHKSLLSFFEKHVPGVVPDLISPGALMEQFSSNPHLPLISLACTPYHHGSSVVILGDAAHAMVPFYGQGMNAGMEDVRVLFSFLDSHGVYKSSTSIQSIDRTEARGKALTAYTENRTPDAHAISSLALSNYYEMRSAVTSPLYLLRKHTEELLCKHLPSWGWATQYTRVSFENERYSQVRESVRRQSNWLLGVLLGTGSSGALIVGAGIWAWKLRRR